MIAEIEVLRPGLFSTIQDEGRFGFLNFGVPMSGPMDIYAARLGNLILNNSHDAPVLEITQTGPSLQFHGDANIVIIGGNLTPMINGSEIKNGKIYFLKKGDILNFGKRLLGSRAYIAIRGGFICEKVLGSCSWYEGLTRHFKFERGMKLYFNPELQIEVSSTSGVKYDDSYLSQSIVPVYPGPEFHLLPAKLQGELWEKSFVVDSSSNRMALQLKEKFENTLKGIITGPVIPGTVQLTPSGKLIILMRDCQTTGGYPRVLQVSREGLNILAQKISGDNVNFRPVDNNV